MVKIGVFGYATMPYALAMCILHVYIIIKIGQETPEMKLKLQKHVPDMCRIRETITNQFLDLKNPCLESKIINIGPETPEIWGGH